ncbi:hypothetical protein MFAL_08680 [Mycolicibacterium fallax]|nr:hypothetical protein MFAL_08680 [Mycolicibacterium fallax]
MLATIAVVGATAPGGEPALPVAAAAPSTVTVTATPSGTAKTTTSAGGHRTDDGGYVGTDAHCGADSTAVAYGRTARSLVALCVNGDGPVEYRGVRISDGALLKVAATDLGDGSYRATNDEVDYTVTPKELRVTSGDSVIYRDTWIEFNAPRYAAEQGGAPTTTAAPTTTRSAG